MTTENDLPKLEDEYKNTFCYTYEVTMVIQVLAPDKDVADIKLDRDGGYISKRDVVLLESTLLYNDSPHIEDDISSIEKKDN